MPNVTKFKRKINKYTLEFSDSESLIRSTLYLKNERLLKSRLYRINGRYRLLLESIKPTEQLYTVKEFCNKFYRDEVHFEYTAEHGTAIIVERAVVKIANAFFKDF